MMFGSFQLFSGGKKAVKKIASRNTQTNGQKIDVIGGLVKWSGIGTESNSGIKTEVISLPNGGIPDITSQHRTCAVVIRDTIYCKNDNEVVLLVSPGTHAKQTMYFIKEQIKNHTNLKLVHTFQTTSSVIGSFYENIGDYQSDDDDKSFDKEDQWVPQIIRKIISDAVEKNASDIHLTLRSQLKIQFRTNGLLGQYGENLTHNRGQKILVTLFKHYVSKTIDKDFNEHERISAPLTVPVVLSNGRKTHVKLRYEQAPGASLGDSKLSLDVVMRINSVGDSVNVESLQDRGFDREAVQLINRIANMNRGIFFVVGGTGTGKSSTLQSFYQLAVDNCGQTRKMLVIEDPVEAHITGVNKQPFRSVGSSNRSDDVAEDGQLALASAMRQDPDVLGYGEIRDPELAKLVIQAAITGHLVGTTMHVSRWVDAYARAISFFNISPQIFCARGTIQAIIAQSLTQKVCKSCAWTYEDVKAKGVYSDIADIEKYIKDECNPLHEDELGNIDKDYLTRIGVPKDIWHVDYKNLRFINNSPDNNCPMCKNSPGTNGRALLYEIFVPSRHDEVVEILKDGRYDEAYYRWKMSGDNGTSKVDGYSLEQRAKEYAHKGMICTHNLLSIIGRI